MRKFLFVAILLVTGVSTAQIKLSGVVKDSIGSPLEMANVIAIDTVAKTISSYGFTDSKGNYKLDLKKNSVYNIKISYIGFKSISQFVKTNTTDIVRNHTMFEDDQLDGIEIVSKMPVTIKGDTIIYNAKVYTINEAFDIQESFAITNGKFIAIGTNQSIQEKYTAKEKIEKAGGAVNLNG